MKTFSKFAAVVCMIFQFSTGTFAQVEDSSIAGIFKKGIINMIKYFFFCILIYSTIYADDVYLKNGFVYRNVQVADTKNGQLKVRKDSIDMLFDTLDVLKIERRNFVPGQKSSYELFSKELQDNYFNNQIEIEQKKMTTKTDSIRNII